jgi:hypothetical protein
MKNELNNARHTCWTPERRAAQASRIRQQKPWERATGPRTQAGKETSKANALKHGWHTAAAAELRQLLREQRHYTRGVLERLKKNQNRG